VANFDKDGWHPWIGPDLRHPAFKEVDGRPWVIERLIPYPPPDDGIVMTAGEMLARRKK
jgi:hypothetical protein